MECGVFVFSFVSLTKKNHLQTLPHTAMSDVSRTFFVPLYHEQRHWTFVVLS